MDRTDPTYGNDPNKTPGQRTPGWEPVVGTTYEPQDERVVVHERDVEHDPSVDEDGDHTTNDKDATGYDRR